MPALRLSTTANGIRASEFDVVGSDADATEISEFVVHVGLLLAPPQTLDADDFVKLLHMAPPLERNQGGCVADVWGSAALAVDECRKIKLFADDRIGENEKKQTAARLQYVVRPHAVPIEAPDGTVIRWRFSCAGFVVEAYQFARVDLLETDESQLPLCTLETLRIAYSDPVEQLPYLEAIREVVLSSVARPLVGRRV